MMKKLISLLLALCLALTGAAALAENDDTTNGQQMSEMPAPPDGEAPGAPPEGMEPPDGMGTPPEGMEPPDGKGTPPDGKGGPGGQGGPGGPGGGQGFSGEYTAVVTADSDMEITEDLASEGTDENALLVTGGNVAISGVSVTRASDSSAGGDAASFYGVGAALLATGGVLTAENLRIETDADGGAGVFSCGEGTVYVSDSTIHTARGTSGGVHVAGGGKLYAENLIVTTEGASSAAIRSDRGGGTMVVNGGSYVSNGSGSPAVYVTADISVLDAELAATGSEALCLEGLNTVRLYNCTLAGNMPDQEQNDNTWTVILYQSMSGDSQVGQGTFMMDGGKLESANGGLFYTTNTESVFVLRGVEIEQAEDCEYFLRCTGNSNARGWGKSGENGADCDFTAISQQMKGDVIWDSVSTLDLYLTEGSELTGAALDDETNAGSGGDGFCRIVIDETSAWVVTADSRVTRLENAGRIIDADGKSVTVLGTDGTVYEQGESTLTVTVDSYAAEADLSGAGAMDAREAHMSL